MRTNAANATAANALSASAFRIAEGGAGREAIVPIPLRVYDAVGLYVADAWQDEPVLTILRVERLRRAVNLSADHPRPACTADAHPAERRNVGAARLGRLEQRLPGLDDGGQAAALEADLGPGCRQGLDRFLLRGRADGFLDLRADSWCLCGRRDGDRRDCRLEDLVVDLVRRDADRGQHHLHRVDHGRRPAKE